MSLRLQSFFTNEVFVCVMVATLVSFIWKIIDTSIRKKRFDGSAFIDTGGMPSTHAAFTVSLATSIGLVEGFTSSIFFVAASFSLIVLRDAVGVRRAVDELAHTVNEIIKKKRVGVEEILKITGHTPVQMLSGSLLGIGIPLILHFAFY